MSVDPGGGGGKAIVRSFLHNDLMVFPRRVTLDAVQIDYCTYKWSYTQTATIQYA